MAGLLIRHKLDQETILGGQPSGLKICDGESSKTVVEEIELNPLLVQSECQGLVVEVR
jgi:hypothetical protein